MMTKLFFVLAANLLICAGLCGLCIGWIDKPTALFVAHHFTSRLPFQIIASPSLFALPFALSYLAVAAVRRLRGLADLSAHGLLLRLSLAILTATAAKDELKWVFGRSWPSFLVHYGVYGFVPFSNDPGYGGFPSGHTACISAPLLLLCVLKPRYRVLWLGIIALVMAGLVGGGYHYPGDTIAGLFTGLAAAALVWGLMKSA